MVGGLLRAAREIRGEVRCAVLATGIGRQDDVPSWVAFRVRQKLRLSVFGPSKREKCPEGPLLWTGEPCCMGNNASLKFGNDPICASHFTRVNNTWTEAPSVCE
jgi:hypothetical protein